MNFNKIRIEYMSRFTLQNTYQKFIDTKKSFVVKKNNNKSKTMYCMQRQFC